MKSQTEDWSGPFRAARRFIRSQDVPGLMQIFARFALGCGFLSAVADRFGLWGPHGSPQVVWGDFVHFEAYTAQLNTVVPTLFIPLLAGLSTVLEIVFGVALLLGFRTRLISFASAALLAVFAGAMTLTLGVKAPLDFSVFSACAAALLLATVSRYRWSIDDRFTH